MIETSHPFYLYFEKIYQDRWPQLFLALSEREQQVARLNMFVDENHDVPNARTLSVPGIDQQVKILDHNSEFSIDRSSQDLLDKYVMDPASIFAALALKATPGCRVLDMCAAPGGKSLVIAEAIFADQEHADVSESALICNDLSDGRRERLKKVIQQYIPRAIRDQVWVYGKDAVQYGLKESNSFDRVLLDAPCSGERHLIENNEAMKEWSPRRTEHLATRQYSLLSAALLAVKEEGRIVYSTCSISPEENDEVIRKLLKKKKDQVQLLEVDLLKYGAEKTEFGYMFMPDTCGFGPIYVSVIQKNY